MRALGSVDEDEVSEDEAAEDEVEVDSFRGEAGKEDREGDGGEEDSGDKGGTVAMMEAVAGFEGGFVGGLCVEKPIAGIERPDGDEHGERW